MENAEKTALLEQYKIFNYSKEQFISRTFTTNRFYMVLSMVLLIIAYSFITFTPASFGVVVACILGLLISILWWLNVDAYNVFIKIKYKNVIDVLEEKLPASPFLDEYRAFQERKKKKFSFIFSDVQKFFASFMFVIFLLTIVSQVWLIIRFFPKPF